MDAFFVGLLTSIVLILGLLGVLGSSVLVSRRLEAGLAILSLMALSNWDLPIWPSLIVVSGISITLPDVLTVVFMLAASFRFRKAVPRLMSVSTFLLVALVIALAYSLISGVRQYGLGTSVNEARAWISIVCVSAWVLTFDCASSCVRNRFEQWLVWTGLGVCIVALVHMAMYGLGNASSGVLDDNGITAIGGRPITAVQAMFLCIPLLICLSKWVRQDGNWYLAAALVFLTFVVITQHRTVWTATAVGVLAVLLSAPIVRSMIAAWWILLCGLAVYIVALFGGLVAIGGDLSVSLEDSDTYNGRLYDWTVLIGRSVSQGYDTILLGSPFGTGWARIRWDGVALYYIPHNWYVATYLRIGIVGLLILLAILIVGLLNALGSMRVRPEHLAVPTAILVYGWAYNVQWYVVPILVLYLAGSIMKDHEQRLLGRDEHGPRANASASPSNNVRALTLS